jgi:hypothetical protein
LLRLPILFFRSFSMTRSYQRHIFLLSVSVYILPFFVNLKTSQKNHF